MGVWGGEERGGGRGGLLLADLQQNQHVIVLHFGTMTTRMLLL